MINSYYQDQDLTVEVMGSGSLLYLKEESVEFPDQLTKGYEKTQKMIPKLLAWSTERMDLPSGEIQNAKDRAALGIRKVKTWISVVEM